MMTRIVVIIKQQKVDLPSSNETVEKSKGLIKLNNNQVVLYCCTLTPWTCSLALRASNWDNPLSRGTG